MKTLLGVLAAFGVLVVGAALAAALLGTFDPAQAQDEGGAEEQAPSSQDDDGTDSAMGLIHGFTGDFVDDVLADLVEDNTITRAQADEISAAFEARIDEMVAPRLESLLGEAGPLRGFLEDGELSDEERAQLEELFGNHLGEGRRFGFFPKDGEAPEDLEGVPFGGRGFRFFLEKGEVPEELQELLESFDLGDVPFGGFFEDGELSDEERAQLREFFGRFHGRGFGGPFDGLDPAGDADEAAYSA